MHHDIAKKRSSDYHQGLKARPELKSCSSCHLCPHLSDGAKCVLSGGGKTAQRARGLAENPFTEPYKGRADAAVLAVAHNGVHLSSLKGQAGAQRMCTRGSERAHVHTHMRAHDARGHNAGKKLSLGQRLLQHKPPRSAQSPTLSFPAPPQSRHAGTHGERHTTAQGYQKHVTAQGCRKAYNSAGLPKAYDSAGLL